VTGDPALPPTDADGTSLSPRKRRAFRLVLAGVAFLLALVVSECTARIVVPPASRYLVWEPNMHRVLEPEPEFVPGVEGDGRFITNALGYRADPAPADDRFRILALGGSTTECLYLDQTEIWTALLQETLSAREPTWVANAGKAGLNASHHALQAEKLLDQEPGFDAVIVLVGVNDFRRAFSWPEKPYRNAKAVRHKAFARFPLAERFPRSLGLWRCARIVRDLGVTSSSKDVQDTSGSHLNRRRKERQDARQWLEQLPDMEHALTLYEGHLKSMIESCKARGVPCVLITQPTVWRDGLPDELERLMWMGDVDSQEIDGLKVQVPTPLLAQGMQAFNDRTKAVAARHSVGVIDLTASIPGDLTAFFDDCHFNENGARLVAGEVARQLDELLPSR